MLCRAVDERNCENIQTILNYEYTDVNKEGPISPLLTAVRRGDPNIVQILLGHKNISVNQDSDQMTALTEVTEILEIDFHPTNCLTAGCQLPLDPPTFIFIFQAICCKNEKIVEQLLKHPEIDVNKTNEQG